MKLDANIVNQILKNHIRGVVAHYAKSHAVSGALLQDTLDQIDNVLNNTKAALQFGLHHDWMRGTLNQAAKKLDLNLDDDQRKELAFQLAQAHVQGLQKAKDVVSGKEPLDLDEDTQDQTPDKPETRPGNTLPSTSLETLISQYEEHQISSGTWRPGSVRDANAKFNALISYFGVNAEIASITVEAVQAYVRLLQALPPRFSLMKAYKNIPLNELNPEELVKNHPQQLDTTTVRDYMTLTRSLFEYALGLGLIDKNPVPTLLIPKKKQGSAREQTPAYTREQIQQIFKPERFMSWVNYGGGFNPAKFWIPVLMVSTACRLEEVCGLRKVDIVDKGGLCLDIENHDKRQLKTDNSARMIPLPKFVLDIGFKEYVDSVRGEMLFPHLAQAHGKWSHNFSKAWGRYIHNKVGIDDPKISPAHSFRHFTIDLIYKALVPDQVTKQFAGHSPGGSETQQRYAKGLEVGTLREHCVPVIEEAVGPILKGLMVD